MTEQLFDVFLAHNSVDKPQVRAIATKLRERGLKPWLDEEQIPPGKSFQEEIQKAIPQIKSAAIIIGVTGLGKWQIQELRSLMNLFVNRDIPVIPVLLPGVNKIPDNLVFLQELNWVNFENIDDTKAFYNLQWGITQVKPELHSKTVQLTAEEWFNLGYNKGQSGDYQGAIGDFNQAIQFKPDYADAYHNRGVAKDSLGDYQGALADFNQAIKIKPDFQTYHSRGQAKYALGDKQGAIADYNQAIKIKPDFAFSYITRGVAKDSLGDYQGAIADYNQAIKSQPDFQTYYRRGKAKYALGDKQGAIADFNQAIKIKPDFASSYITRGIAKKNLGDKQGAINDYNQAAQLYSQQGNMEMYLKVLDNIKNLEK